ncbi:glutathione S-transferase family protein [Mangrovicoccus algicola]|uniref:Glutathione S-transferase family protein n=1 Tax=Mangrovicoccus algicola TaxID=2771008 RepID=A0A8J6YYW4_9RHOB|nr:glutathione S-transferase family protein [Mangrovicoccus algicola]MBE3640135.1 glutathione S-transferase family protein [Mangrovicoccus algicola]
MYEVIGSVKTRTFRVLWLLEELGQPYRFIEETPRSAGIVALNPLGKVPALRVDGDVLTDSVAIMTFLADRHGAFTAPAGTVARARQDALSLYIIDEMDAILWSAAKHSFVLPEEKRVADLKPTLGWEYDRAVRHLCRRLEKSPFLCGDALTLPDILAAHCAEWAKAAKILPRLPLFDDYLARLAARPAFQGARDPKR